jgi:hypothetical protein
MLVAGSFEYNCSSTIDWPVDPDICASHDTPITVQVDTLVGHIEVDSAFPARPQSGRRGEVNCAMVDPLPHYLVCTPDARAHGR